MASYTQMNKIPLYVHIPRTAGTYIIGAFQKIFTSSYFGTGEIIFRQMLNVTEYGGPLFKFFVTSSRPLEDYLVGCVKHPVEKRSPYISQEDFYIALRQHRFDIFAAVVELRGFNKLANGLIPKLQEISGETFDPFFVNRDTLSRSFSIYSYLTGDESEHEPTHKIIKHNNFEEYIKSNRFESNWITRHLSEAPYSRPLNMDDFNKACSVLDKIGVVPIESVNFFLEELARRYFTTDGAFFEKDDIFKNYSNKKENPMDISRDTYEIFMDKSKFDMALYDRYTDK
jgi:hypothetical protein